MQPRLGLASDHTGPLLKSSDVESFFHSLDQPTATATTTPATQPTTTPPRYEDSASAGSGSGSSTSAEENIPPASTLLPPLSISTTHSPSSNYPLPVDYHQHQSLHYQSGSYLLDKKMYQNSLALPPTAPTYSPHHVGDNAAGSFMASGTSPVYVPSTRAMLPVQYMSSPQGVTSNTSSLWPTSSESAYTSQSLHPSVTSTFPFAPPPAPGAQIPSPTGRADGGMGVGGFGSPLSRANGLSPYSPYMGTELSPWNSFNNMAMQQGFRQTGPDDH
nr:hypothetical protein BaRGS_027007 [Batillaria attramentaria]